MQVSEIHEKSLGKGIDARNAESQLETGFWETLINAESDGDIVKKRKGYQQLGGYLPFRVRSIEYSTTELCFNLDNYVDLSRLRSSPLVVKGTAYYDTATPHDDFLASTFSENYYSGFDVSIRRTGTSIGTVDNPSYTFTIPAEAHGHSSWIQHSNIYQSTSESNLSNELVYPDKHEIQGTADLDTTTNLLQTDITVTQDLSYIHASIDASVLGANHYYPNSSGSPLFLTKVGDVWTTSFDVTLTALQSSNLIITVYRRLTAGTVEKVIPDDITITGTAVDITINNATDTSEYFYVATAVPDANIIAGQVTASVQSVVIPNVSPFTSFAVYTVDAGVREYVFPDTAVYDDTTEELTISFETNEALNYQIYYTTEELRVNQFCVQTSTGVAGASSTVELDVYGIDPLEVIEEENRNHWLTHIDTYRSEGISELLTSVAGVPYKIESTSLSTLYPRYEQVLETGQYIIPYFQNSGQTFTLPGRGYLTMGSGFSGPELTTIAYQSGSGYVRFTLSATALSLTNITVGAGDSEYVDNLDGTFTSSLESDLLTVQEAGYSIMNGSHLIQSLTVDPANDLIYVDCSVDGVTNSDFDEQEVGGYAQIYTSPLTIKSTADSSNTIVPGSTITVGGENYAVRGNSFASEEKIYISDVNFNTELSSGLFILGTNTSYVHPVRTQDAASVDEYVKGDMVKYTGLDRWIKVDDIVQMTTQDVTLAGSTLTFNTTADLALNFEAGQKIQLMTEGLEGAVVTINSVSSTETLELDTSFTATSARLIGQTFELDESLLVADTVDNSLAFSPTGRWNAILKPPVPDTFDASDRTVQYPFNAFETTQQGFIRSTMVADNMYLTNGEDAVLKYDGSSVSRAGLFRWEGGLFVRKVLESGGAIVHAPTTESGSITIGSKSFTGVNAGSFTVGQSVILKPSNFETTVTEVDVSNQVLSLEDPATAADTSITSASILKYYFRLNMIDANDNIIGSAASGVDNNYTIQMTDDTTVGIKLAKPPKLPLLDYDRLEYEIYRTKQDGAVFFKVATIQITHENTDDYIYYEDTLNDSQLTEADPVSVSTVGAELATAVDEPLRAKYVTSANNRLILGNLKTSPRVDVQIFRPSTELSTSELADLSFSFTNSTSTIDYKFTDAAGTAITAIDASGNLTGGPSLTAGRWVYVYKTTNSEGSPEYLGWFKVLGANQIDYNGSAYAGISDVNVIEAGDLNEIPVFTGAEASDDDSAYQTGGNQLLISTKLLNAIHGTQFKLPFSLAGEGRTDNAEVGRFSIRSLDNSAFNLTITHTSSPNLFDRSAVFVNNTAVSSEDITAAKVTTYASRMLVSFQNFPEIFDRPRAIIPEDSLSVIDVNSADGQEITGIIPFFGESTSQDSRKQDVVICFKENSIYAINITTRQITKIDSRGVGCNAPHSIAAVPNGIIFAARSGVYRLNRSFDVIWVGRYLDRLWKENTNLDQLALATGHVYPQEKQYRLSVAVGDSGTASEVYTYEYGDEQAGQTGAWGQFNNIPSTGWASDGVESYFASSKGRMYTIRNTDTDSDYRDDSAPVNWEVVYRGMDFDAPGRRKIVRAIVSHFRVLKTDSGTSMDVGVDLLNQFTSTTSYTLQDSVEDGLSTIISSKVKSIRQNIANQKGIYFQVRYTNSTIDTPVALCGITFMVAGLDHRGIQSASETNE